MVFNIISKNTRIFHENATNPFVGTNQKLTGYTIVLWYEDMLYDKIMLVQIVREQGIYFTFNTL